MLFYKLKVIKFSCAPETYENWKLEISRYVGLAGKWVVTVDVHFQIAQVLAPVVKLVSKKCTTFSVSYHHRKRCSASAVYNQRSNIIRLMKFSGWNSKFRRIEDVSFLKLYSCCTRIVWYFFLFLWFICQEKVFRLVIPLINTLTCAGYWRPIVRCAFFTRTIVRFVSFNNYNLKT